MHREHMEAAISSAIHGGKVAIFTENLHCADGLAHEAEEAAVASESVWKVNRVNGRRAIHFRSGGSIRFISIRQSARGLSLDRAFVPIGVNRDILAAIIPALCTSQEGVLTGYY